MSTRSPARETTMIRSEENRATAEWTEAFACDLVQRSFDRRIGSVLGIGCSGETGSELEWRLGAERFVVLHPDAERAHEFDMTGTSPGVSEWRSGDLYSFAASGETYDLVLMIDVLHEVYSIDGRGGCPIEKPIVHDLGIAQVRRVLEEAREALTPEGALLIATEIASIRPGRTRLKSRNAEARRFATGFSSRYPSRKIEIGRVGDGEFEIANGDLGLFFSQWDRPEPAMLRPFFTLEDWRVMLHDLGFDLHIEVGTPAGVRVAREEAFEIESSSTRVGDSRAVILAVPRR